MLIVVVVVMVVVVMVVVAMMVVVMRVVPMTVLVTMVLVLMVVRVMMIVAGVIVGAAFRAKGARHRCCAATLTAHHLGQHMVGLDIDRVGRHFGWRVAIADVPGDPQQPERIFGAHLQKPLGRGLDLDEPAIVELQRVAIVEDRGLVEIDKPPSAFSATRRFCRPSWSRVSRSTMRSCLTAALRTMLVARFIRLSRQNRKYRCAIGSTFAGSQTSNSPSAVTA
jgi:hypothetical protein